MKRLPESVKVGPYTYRVKECSPVFAGKDGSRLCGNVNHTKLRIRVDKRMAPGQKVETFFHECLHAISVTTNLELPEDTVARLSMALTAFLLDNDLLKDV